MTSSTSLVIHTSRPQMLLLSSLFGAGVGIACPVGISLVELLCDRMGIAPDYLEQRVQTIFVDGRTVDRPEQVTITDRATVALSAAMPGLMGATLRKGGLLAVFRKDISQRPMEYRHSDHHMTMVTLKLFNLVAREIGPLLLQNGVWLKGAALADHFARIGSPGLAALEAVFWNDQPIAVQRLLAMDWPDGWVQLTVLSQTP